MNDRSSRPEIASETVNMNEYDVIFVGFPIWWYREPSIIDTFMESYDFTDKTIVPFATSGMSPIGDSGKNMQALAPGAKVAVGKHMYDNREQWIRSRNELNKALKALGLLEDLGSAIAKHLGSPKAIDRMTAYLYCEKPKTDELVVDEMLAIRSEIEAWREKKASEEVNAVYNEMLYYGLGTGMSNRQ